ncbi:MAG: sodium transporter [Myxococcota bacterium]
MIDAALVLAFVVWSVGTGFRDRREASRDLTAYFLAGRRLPGWQSGLSMAATQYSADTPMLAAGLVATGGIAALWRLWSYGIAFLLLGFLLAPAWWRAGVLTDAELCELRYSGRAASLLRAVKAIYFGFVFNCAALAMVLTAAVRIAEAFLDWQAWLPTPVFAAIESLVREVGVPLSANPDPEGLFARTASNLISVVAIFGFTLLYSATGGLRSVIRTDVMQLALVGLSTAAYAGFAIAAVGGLEQLPIRLAELEGAAAAATRLSFDPRQAAEAGGTLLAIVGLQWLLQMNSDGTGYLAQRCMACHSADEARRAPVYFAFVQILGRSLLWLPILVALLVLFPLAEGQTPAERELAFVSGIDALLPIGVRGLMLVGMLAALASTLDTHLNWGASYLTNDLFARFLAPRWLAEPARSRALVWCARACSPLLMIASLALMSRLGSIQEAWHVTLTLGAGLGIPLLLRWLWRRANAWGELAAIGASGLAAWLGLRSGAEESTRLLFVGAVGAVAAVAGSLATRPETDDRLDAFFERVRPPGFWGVPEARRALVAGLVRTGAAAITLYGLLVGLGILLVGAPAPIPIPRPLFVAACLAVATGAAPVWLRGLRSRPPSRAEPPRASR